MNSFAPSSNCFISPILAESGQLHIKVAGLECMNNNYQKVNVLYANAKICTEKNEDILQHLTNSIAKHFYEKGKCNCWLNNILLFSLNTHWKYISITYAV